MATDFPTGLDTLSNPSSGDKLDSPDHAGQHTDANDAIEAIEGKVGIDGSTNTMSLDYKTQDATSSRKGISSFDEDSFVVTAGDVKPKIIGARARQVSTAQTVTGTPTQITLDTEDYDTGNDFASNQFTVPVSGYYYLRGSIEWNGSHVADGEWRRTFIYKDGSKLIFGDTETAALSTIGLVTSASDIQHLDSGDTIQLYGQTNGTGNQTNADANSFTSLTCVLMFKD